MKVRLQEPERLIIVSQDLTLSFLFHALTSIAPFTDSSHKSMMNSSNAMDSLSTEMTRWHSCGRKNSISS